MLTIVVFYCGVKLYTMSLVVTMPQVTGWTSAHATPVVPPWNTWGWCVVY